MEERDKIVHSLKCDIKIRDGMGGEREGVI